MTGKQENLANSWDYGPLGVEFKNNVKKAWLKKFVQESPYNVGLDANFGCRGEEDDLECAPRSLCASSAEELF